MMPESQIVITRLKDIGSRRPDILLDNDFLSLLSSDTKLYSSIVQEYSNSIFLLEDFVKIEFLTGPINKTALESKYSFLAKNKEIGLIIPTARFAQNDSWIGFIDNMINLRRIFSRYKLNDGISFVDLSLISRLVMSPNTHIMTGNYRHFCLDFFDVESIITRKSVKKNGEQKVVEIKQFYELSISKEKIQSEKEQLNTILSKST